jgi:phosphate uptake regulator
MERRLVKHGESTLMVSVPKKWLKKNNLSKGDAINFEESGNQLVLNGKKTKKTEKRIVFTLPENPARRWIRAFISHSYRKGATKISIRNCSADSVKTIIEVNNDHLIGFEINQVNKNTIELEQILDDNLEHFQNFFHKILFLIENSLIELKDYLKNNDKEIYASLIRSKTQTDKYINYCKRGINTGILNIDKSIYWDCLSAQTQVIHAIIYLIKYIEEHKFVLKNKEIFGLLDEIKDYYSKCKKAVLKEKIDFEFEEEYARLRSKFLEILEKTKSHESCVMWFLGEQIRHSMLFIYRFAIINMIDED